VRRAQAHPARPQDALKAPTADLNGHGFVTMDEVVAMKRTGFSDRFRRPQDLSAAPRTLLTRV
jgi:hypothetical protein